MPVYDRRYRGYAGERRSTRAGVWTLTRFALRQLFDSKLTLVLAVAIGLVPLGYAGFIYLANNLDVLQAAGFGGDPGYLVGAVEHGEVDGAISIEVLELESMDVP